MASRTTKDPERRRVAQRRRRARDMHERGKSYREIAKAMGVGLSTVQRYLTAPVGPNTLGDQTGNQLAVKHGTTSERVLGPIRDRLAPELRQRYPDLDDVRQALLLNLLSKIEAGESWVAQMGHIVRNDQGEIWPVVKHLAQWGTQADRLIQGLEEERQAREKGPLDFETYLEANYSPEARARRAAEESNGDGS